LPAFRQIETRVNLTDLVSLKTYLTNTSPNSDAVLARLVSSASSDFLTEIGRAGLESQTYTEVRDGTGSCFMQLLNYPVNGFGSLQINNSVVPLSSGWNSSGYQWDANGKLSLIGFNFCWGRRNVIATYPAGYLPLTIEDELQTIPAAAPYVINLQNPNWRSDEGVAYFVGGADLTPVTGAPAVGEYFVTPIGQNYAGQYLFNAADAGKQVQISYTCSGVPTDVSQAVVEIAAIRYRQRDRMDVNSMSIGGTTTQYSKEDYPSDVWRIIKKYKRYFSIPGM
jgi:hypothetical protein